VPNNISIHNATENNLKNISLEIPKNKLVVVTGVSGSGKSSLVHDVIYREAENRYLGSFSSYARQFIGKMKKPDVEKIDGLSPAIAVNQKSVARNPRSTVGTMTGIYDYLRLIFARLGKTETTNTDFKINRNLFSFNSPAGACENCKGLGVEDRLDPSLFIADENKTLREGALVITTPSGYIIYSQVTMDVLNQVCKSEGFNVDIPWKDLTKEQKQIILYGSNKIEIPFGKHTLESRMRWSGITAKPREMGFYKGIIPIMETILKQKRNKNILRFVRTENCSLCEGRRLNKKALAVKWQGKNITEIAAMPVSSLSKYLSGIELSRNEEIVAGPLIGKIRDTIALLDKLGTGYLSLDRESTTLSGGEAQRLRLATQVTSKLSGVLYIFDEPSIGLHASENQKMLKVLHQLRNNGNTVIVVEHDDDFIRQADHVIDIGPRAGIHGGQVLLNDSYLNLSNIHSTETQKINFLQVMESF
jgi:excinuclease ABC subunit A